MKKNINLAPEEFDRIMSQFEKLAGDMENLPKINLAVLLDKVQNYSDDIVDEIRKTLEDTAYFDIVFRSATDLSIYVEEKPSKEQNLKRISNAISAIQIYPVMELEQRLSKLIS